MHLPVRAKLKGSTKKVRNCPPFDCLQLPTYAQTPAPVPNDAWVQQDWEKDDNDPSLRPPGELPRMSEAVRDTTLHALAFPNVVRCPRDLRLLHKRPPKPINATLETIHNVNDGRRMR